MMVNDRVTAGASLQARCGLRFLLSATWLAGSITAKAKSPGMAVPSMKLSLCSLMVSTSNESGHRVWHVGRLELGDLLGSQLQLQRADGVPQMLRLGRANNRRGDLTLLQHPRERHLRHGHAAPPGNLGNLVDNRAIGVCGRAVELLAKNVLLGAVGARS